MSAPRRVRKKGLIRRYAGPGVDSFLMASPCQSVSLEHFAFEIIQFQKRRCHHFA